MTPEQLDFFYREIAWIFGEDEDETPDDLLNSIRKQYLCQCAEPVPAPRGNCCLTCGKRR